MLLSYTVIALRNYYKDQKEEKKEENKEKSLNDTYKDYFSEKVKEIHQRDSDLKSILSKNSKRSKCSQKTKGSQKLAQLSTSAKPYVTYTQRPNK